MRQHVLQADHMPFEPCTFTCTLPMKAAVPEADCQQCFSRRSHCALPSMCDRRPALCWPLMPPAVVLTHAGLCRWLTTQPSRWRWRWHSRHLLLRPLVPSRASSSRHAKCPHMHSQSLSQSQLVWAAGHALLLCSVPKLGCEPSCKVTSNHRHPRQRWWWRRRCGRTSAGSCSRAGAPRASCPRTWPRARGASATGPRALTTSPACPALRVCCPAALRDMLMVLLHACGQC